MALERCPNMALTAEQKKQMLEATRAAIDRQGGIEVIRAQMDAFHKLNLRVDAEYPQLRDKYPNQWICMGKNGVLATGHSQEEVLETVRRKGISASEVVFEYISPEDTIQIV